MPKQLCLSAVIELPEDLFEASAIITAVKVPWYAALQTLKQNEVPFKHSQDVMEVRAKAARKPRKPRLVPTSGEAA
jgi:hypothetical protein